MQTSQTTTIEIDIDVHRAIEARRTDFGQSRNDILREVFGMRSGLTEPAEAPASIARTRRTGQYAFTLHGKRTEAGSLKEAYLGCLRALAQLQPAFLEKLGTRSTRARRVVAREPKALFLKKPELAEKFAAPLCPDWWADTNLSRPQCEHRLNLACDVAQIAYGQDLVVEFPN